MPQSRTEIFTQIVNLLEPLSDQDKLNTVRAALVYFGQADAETVPPSKSASSGEAKEEAPGDDVKLSPQASRWLKQHNFQIDSLDTVFHWDGDVVDVIASDVPGTSKKEKLSIVI